ncbi:hypothetical protein EN816_30875 [Mesorhizobium sp. M8A.F.Ca.ET.173.01.1.1]|nr:hypothetical protein EN816_30875 [Mesorhizobium sp. M8A.F.Ca.ET.173.01.1.1]
MADSSSGVSLLALLISIRAAPHLPAGILSPYSDGRGALPPAVSPIAVLRSTLYKKGGRKYERPRLFGWRGASPGMCSMMSAEP